MADGEETADGENTAARLAALRAEHERVVAQAVEARTRMLSDRLTRSRKEAQLREAQVEEADDQADYFAGRVAETDDAAHESEAHHAALEARAEAVRGGILTVQIDDALAGYDVAFRDLLPQIAAVRARMEAAAGYVQRARAWADELPPAAFAIPRDAVAVATERYIAVEGLLRDLEDALSAELAFHHLRRHAYRLLHDLEEAASGEQRAASE